MNSWKTITIVTLLVGGFVFFWFAIRPSQIKKTCIQKAQQEAGGGFTSFELRYGVHQSKQERIDVLYKNCLRESGL